jgi:RimJ/RimL family protein N-acetyltransferase
VTRQYTIRAVRAHEWREVRDLRLDALSDEAAGTAFRESHREAAARPDRFWQDRTRSSSLDAGPGAGARQFVAVAGDGRWVGTAVALVEEAGGHVVGVYVVLKHRGRGVAGDLLRAVTDWLRELGLDRVRLHVHADDVRARRAYERSGCRPTGTRRTGTIGPELEMAHAL